MARVERKKKQQQEERERESHSCLERQTASISQTLCGTIKGAA